MTNQKPAIMYALQSRKFWSAVVGLAAIFYMAWAKGDTLDPDTIVNAILGIVAAYMATTAWEDTARARAEAPPVTTVTTPGTSDVQVTQAPDATPAPVAPVQPVVERIGLV